MNKQPGFSTVFVALSISLASGSLPAVAQMHALSRLPTPIGSGVVAPYVSGIGALALNAGSFPNAHTSGLSLHSVLSAPNAAPAPLMSPVPTAIATPDSVKPLVAQPVSAWSGLKTIAAAVPPDATARQFDAGLPFDGGVRAQELGPVEAPYRGSSEQQKLARAHEIAVRGSLGVQGMFDQLAEKGLAPKYMMANNWRRQAFATTGDDPELLGEAKQIIFARSMLQEQSVEFIAAAIAVGITRHFFAEVYPESAEKTYIGWSVGLRTFLEAAGIRKSTVDSWTNKDDYYGGNPWLHKHFQFWYGGVNPNADAVRNGAYFKNKILLQQGDPTVYVRDQRGATTVYGRSQNEPGAWWGNTGKTLTQAAAEAQQRFESFIKKEVDWMRNWVRQG